VRRAMSTAIEDKIRLGQLAADREPDRRAKRAF
jgi:hypothetical protein